MPTQPEYTVTATDTVMVGGVGLSQGPSEIRDAVFGWLHDHGLSENDIRIWQPITRDPDARTLTYPTFPRDENGRRVAVKGGMFRTISAPADAGEVWPEPFPQIVLGQPNPGECPTCGQVLPERVPRHSPCVGCGHPISMHGEFVDDEPDGCAAADCDCGLVDPEPR